MFTPNSTESGAFIEYEFPMLLAEVDEDAPVDVGAVKPNPDSWDRVGMWPGDAHQQERRHG